MRPRSIRYFALAGALFLASAGCRERPAETRAEITADRQFAILPDSPQALPAASEFDCSLENVRTVSDNSSNPGDVPNSWKIEKGATYELSGFAIDKTRGDVPESIRLLLVGQHVYSVTAKTGVERPDVASYFTWGKFSHAGYSTQVAFDDVASGEYEVIVSQMEGSKALVCRTFQTIKVR